MEPKNCMTTGDVARILGIPRWQLTYLIERQEVPEASLKIPGRRLFTDEDVGRIREALAQRGKGKLRAR